MFPTEVNLGIGTWAWGDRLIWDYGRDYREEDLFASFRRCINDGIRFFSTSSSFAEGESELILGRFNAQTPVDLLIATKYVPRIWHLRRSDFMDSLKQSLLRLKLNKINIYQICPPVGRMTAARLAESSAEALDLGLIEQVGLSGFTLQQLDTFNEALSRFGYSISCLETPYNLLERSIETNGLLDFCRSQNIRVIAQQPLAMGMLTGKYNTEAPASGIRRQMMMRYYSPRMDILLRTMNHIGLENNGKNPAQVALNWIMSKGIVPLPGIKTLSQAIENTETVRWSMTKEQINLLDTLTGKSDIRMANEEDSLLDIAQ